MTLTDDQRIPTLVITANPDNTGQREFRFDLAVGTDTAPWSYTEGIRTQYVDAQSGVLTIFDQLLGGGNGSESGGDNRTFALDLGNSVHIAEIEFANHEDSTYQWGDGSGSLPADATGAEPIEQVQTLTWVLNHVRIDSAPGDLADGVTGSFGPAQLEVGMRHPSGPLSPLDVIIESPRVTTSATQPSGVTGSFTALAVGDLGEIFDAEGRTPRGT